MRAVSRDGVEPGGFAERVGVPAELVGELLVLPDEMDPVARRRLSSRSRACSALRIAPVCGRATACSSSALNGLLTIAAAHARAIDTVWVREPRPERLALAEALGAEHHGNELVDVAIVCTPKPDAIAAAAAALAPGGSLCLYAPPAPGGPGLIDGTALFLRELTVTASYSAGPGDMRLALDLISSGRIDPLPFVSHRFGLEETGRALELSGGGRRSRRW